jgi:hypothetical protein
LSKLGKVSLELLELTDELVILAIVREELVFPVVRVAEGVNALG